MYPNISQVVDRDDRPRLQFTLETNIHLVGAWRLIVWRIKGDTSDGRTGGQCVAYETTIRLCAGLCRRVLKLFLECDHLIGDTANGLAANRGSVNGCACIIWTRQS